MSCLPTAYKTFLSDDPEEMPPAKEPPYHRRFMWEIKIKILRAVYNNKTLVKVSKAIPLESCVREYRTRDRKHKGSAFYQVPRQFSVRMRNTINI